MTTLQVEDDRWERNGDFDWSNSKPQIIRKVNDSFNLEEKETIVQQHDTAAENSTWSEAVMAVFHNGIRIDFENIVLIPVEDRISPRRDLKTLPLSQKPSNIFHFPPHGVQELVVQYKIQPHRNKRMSHLSYLDVGTFLHNDQHCSCGSKDDIEFNIVFRRKLEHILCLCLVRNVPDLKSGPHIPFDTTFALGSTPAGDL